jgi:hypothetical protein
MLTLSYDSEGKCLFVAVIVNMDDASAPLHITTSRQKRLKLEMNRKKSK